MPLGVNCERVVSSGGGLQKRKNHCIAVIGDGAITGGMAYEAMNHAGYLDKNMIVVLNDNQQVHSLSSNDSSCIHKLTRSVTCQHCWPQGGVSLSASAHDVAPCILTSHTHCRRNAHRR